MRVNQMSVFDLMILVLFLFFLVLLIFVILLYFSDPRENLKKLMLFKKTADLLKLLFHLVSRDFWRASWAIAYIVAASCDYFLLSPAYHNNLLDLHEVIVVSTDDESANFKSQF